MIPGLDRLAAAVQANCDVTDARHAGSMTMCTYLLEMRELYRWEHGIPLLAAVPRADVGRWMSEREALWTSLEGESYQPLPLGGAEIDPFDVDAANLALRPRGVVYGAGVGRFGKPQFFLGALERDEIRDGMRILVSGREFARDLAPAPAASRGGTVYVRLESLQRVLAEKMEAWEGRRGDGALKSALDTYAFAAGARGALAQMAADESETLILHELGERDAGLLLGPQWEEMLVRFTRRKGELFARAARDHLADCLVTIPALVARGAQASIHLWAANLDGMRRELFPGVLRAYQSWCGGDQGRALRAAAGAGATHFRDVCTELQALAQRPDGGGEEAIEALAEDAAARL